MEINHLVLTMSSGDAISNSVKNMKKVLNEKGIKSEIYAYSWHDKMEGHHVPLELVPYHQPIIYHFGIGSHLSQLIPHFTSKRMMIYHNITPAHFFRGIDEGTVNLCELGRKDLAFLNPYIHTAFADSEYNRQELVQYGYPKTAVTPIIVDYEALEGPVNTALLQHLAATKRSKDFIFVGRVVPNKRQDDIIKIFGYYQQKIDPHVRLFLVGRGIPSYVESMNRLARQMGLRHVYITGHVPQEDILAYYRNADLFLCMSEHEGFGVPLLEAMHFQLPIIAFDSSAVTETVGTGGIVVPYKEPQSIAPIIQQIFLKPDIKAHLVVEQQKRLQLYSKAQTQAIFWHHIQQEFPHLV